MHESTRNRLAVDALWHHAMADTAAAGTDAQLSEQQKGIMVRPAASPGRRATPQTARTGTDRGSRRAPSERCATPSIAIPSLFDVS
jgi:hypothetical protein